MLKGDDFLCRVINFLFYDGGYKLVCWVVAPLLIYTIPPHLFYEGDSLCLFTRLFGVNCYGCGITRAIFAALHLDFRLAWDYHHCVVVVLPLLIYLWLKGIYSFVLQLRGENKNSLENK